MTSSPMILAIEIGGTKLQIGCVDDSNTFRLVQRFQVDVARGAEGIREHITATLLEVIDEHVAAIGVGFGGPVDWKTGVIATSHHVGGWAQFPLGEWLHGLTRRPVHVENDANAAAFAEATLGAGVGCNPVLYTNSGSGVGAGLVVDGRLYHGAPPGELELGHLRLCPGGAIVEDRCSGWSLDHRVQNQLGLKSARDLLPLLQRHDPRAVAVMNDTASEYAFGLSHAVHLLNPAVIVLGGGVALLGEFWRAAIADQLPGMLMKAMQPGPTVKLAALGESVVPLGAAALARQRFIVPQL